jgi:hypothetical protein
MRSRCTASGTRRLCAELRSGFPRCVVAEVAGLGMADRARDRGKTKAQGPLQLIDLVVNIRHLDPIIHYAVEIHDLA